MHQRERGFTLIELLIVIVIIGVLAAIAIPQMGTVKERAYVGTMKSDLRNLATAEEAYFIDHQAYAGSITELGGLYRRSPKVSVEIEVEDSAWEATATHANTDIECSIQFTDSDPGLPICS